MRKFLALVSVLLSVSSCMSAYRKSVGADSVQVFDRTYLADVNTAWQACLEALKASPLDISNRESGYIQTKWTENTEQKNLIDSFGDADLLQKAQYRFQVTVGKSFFRGQPAVKVTVHKEQLIEHDVLEGWVPVETDSIEENTLLYRIGRIIWMHMKVAQMEEQKEKQQIKDTNF